MATNTRRQSRSSSAVSATIQWVALAVFAVLAVLAAFVFLGEGATGGGTHTGLAPIAADAG